MISIMTVLGLFFGFCSVSLFVFMALIFKYLDTPNNAGHRIFFASILGVGLICFIMSFSIFTKYTGNPQDLINYTSLNPKKAYVIWK